MAALTSNNPTLLDWKQSLDPNGQVATVIELLHETNEVMADVTFMEGNLPTGHRSTIRTGLPSVTWRKLYGGVQPDKAQRATITDTCGMLEAYNEVDKALADLGGNTAAFRLQEATAQVESMTQAFVDTLFYGNVAATPERFEGLSTRYSNRNTAVTQLADNVIHGGGAGADNASIWLVGWGANTCHGIIPKASSAGLQVRDLGEVTVENADGANGRMQAYRMHFRWDCGLCVKDWRYVVRICNIDKSELRADASSGAILPDLMYRAMRLLPSMAGGIRPVLYMSRDVMTTVHQQLAYLTKNSTLDIKDVGGHPTSMFHSIPMRRVDALAADEALVPNS